MGAEEICENSETTQDLKGDDETPVQNIFNRSFISSTQSNGKEENLNKSSPVSEITDSLLLTSATFVNPQTMDQLGVSCIISCAPELPEPPLPEKHIVYCKIDTMDTGSTRILQYFDSTADLIHQISNLGGRTLVFCVAGVSRSATICIAYLMKHKRLTLLQAYDVIKLRRPKIKPNCGFFKQLIEYEKQLFRSNSVQMVYNETVRMEIPDVYDVNYRTPIYLINKKRRQSYCRY